MTKIEKLNQERWRRALKRNRRSYDIISLLDDASEREL
jgi:hypothetical protein